MEIQILEKKFTIWFEYFILRILSVRANVIIHIYSSKNDVSRERSWVVSIAMITHETCVAFRRRRRNVDDSNVHNIIAQLRGLMREPWCGALFGGQGRGVSLGSLGLWNTHNRVNYLIQKIEIEMPDKTVVFFVLCHRLTSQIWLNRYAWYISCIW